VKGIFKQWLESRTVAIWLVLIGATSYGLLSTLIKVAYADLTIGQVTSGQVIIGTLLLWLIVLVRPHSWSNPFAGPWIRLMCIGVFGLLMTTLLFNTALSYLNASIAMVLLFQFTWMTMLMDALRKRRLPTMMQVLAIVFIMSGTVLAVNLLNADFTHLSPVGLLFGIASAFTYSLFIFLTGGIETKMDSVMRSALMWTAAVPIVMLIWPPTYLTTIDMGPFLLWAFVLGSLGQVIPTILFNFGIPRIGSSLAALLGSMELPTAIVFALFILQEHVTVWQWFGMLLILLGILVSELKKSE
jgi:drug/metabolite transporter (DMT)-like permease